MGGWWRWSLVSPDGVAPNRMVGVSASVNLPLHHKSRSSLLAPAHPDGPGKTVVVVVCGGCYHCFDGAVNIASCRLTEMAERHDAKAVLRIARGLVQRVQDLIDNK